MKMKIKYGLILILVLQLVQNILGQNQFVNQQKYWYMRQRLVDKYVSIGPGHGQSIPLSIIHIGATEAWNPTSNLVRKLEISGDATTDLGWYIGILATEIKLLRDANEDFSSTKMELYYALNAFDRLDGYAEMLYDYADINQWTDCSDETCNLPGIPEAQWDYVNHTWLPRSGSIWNSTYLNGWFLRSDGGPELINDFPDIDIISAGISRPWDLSQTTDCNYGHYVDYNPSISYSNRGYYPYNIPSQDQIFHLLMGLMLTSEFAGDATYNGVVLKDKAKQIGMRILDHYSFGLATQTLFLSPINNTLPCNGGGDSWAFEGSLSKMRDYFHFGTKSDVNNQVYAWGTITVDPDQCIDLPNTGLDDIGYQVNRSLYAIITAISNSTPHCDMCKYSTRDGFKWGLYYLLRRAIYPHTPVYSCCDYGLAELVIDIDACPCRGPHEDDYVFNEENGTYYFEVDDQLEFKCIAQDCIDNGWGYPEYQGTQAVKPYLWNNPQRFLKHCNSKQTGEFAGLDYMLLYNLGNIVFGTSLVAGNYTNTDTYTNMNHYYFTNSGPLNAGLTYRPVGFVDIKTDVIIPSSTSVYSKASHFIELNPGFNSQSGSIFEAKIGNVWTCDSEFQSYKNVEINPFVPQQVREINFDRSGPIITKNAEPTNGNDSIMFYEDFQIYPNPTTGILNMQCSIDQNIFIRIFNSNGVEVLLINGNCGNQIDLTHLSNGMYTLIINWENNNEFNQYTGNFVKTN